ncbi:unnamed protein product [Schistosoma turkestanicum]|nr:unnamed protein product [Schistosoma turkestanicum]
MPFSRLICLFIILTIHIQWIYALNTAETNSHHHHAQQENRLAIFSIKFLEFHNHAHRRIDGSCCGRSKQSLSSRPPVNEIFTDLCKDECALEFRICIEPYTLSSISLLNSTNIYHGPCMYGEIYTGHWGNTDITYGLLEANIHSIGIIHPWPRLFTVILEAYDLISSNEKYLIDRAIHRGLLRPLINSSSSTTSSSSTKPINLSTNWHQVTITTQYSGYTFGLQLICEQNHYGNDCTKLCQINNNITTFKCDLNGNKICEPGWSGIECNKAICTIGCHPVHGTCSRPGECDCSTGWQGPLCDECIKYPGCKYGTCHDAPFTCRCLPNWGGPFCDQDLDYCGRHQPCLNNGICKNLNSSYSKPFNCSCTHDFTGEYCEIKLAPCTINPCKRGRCISTDNITYECECEPGWRGDHCEENIDYCLMNTCLNGGTCQDLDGPGFQCLCPAGYKGSHCQLRSPCSNSKCVHAIHCKQLIQSKNEINYECLCQPGWTGQFCDENIDDCVDKCKNGGTCHDLLDDFYCTCPIGFEGRYCEINRECASRPCQNKGICHDIPGGYLCECPNGFTGQNCEISINGCNPNLCQNGAYCYTLSNGFYCKCPEKFYGQFCEYQRPYCGVDGCDLLMDPCLTIHHDNNGSIQYFSSSSSSSSSSSIISSPSALILEHSNLNSNQSDMDNLLRRQHEMIYPYSGVCGQHGTCIHVDHENDYQCLCSTGYQGKYCQELINYCETMPCMNNAICVNSLEGYQCICEEGFSGVQCENAIDLCQPNPCQNGGYCQPTLYPGDFQCHCAPGWSGRWCEFQTNNPCTMAKICFNNGQCYQDNLSPGLFKCECDQQWTGTVCQLRRPESRACIQENLCKNGATCVDLGNSFNCICRPGFDGQYCENDINECNSMPCYNNGTCKDLVNSFECDCPKGFIGTDCRINVNECASYPCSFGSTCIDRVGTYECICPEQRNGRHCDEVIIEIEPKPPACNFYGRIYNHNDNWTYSCQRCHCSKGQIICTDDFCGYWSCLQIAGQNDRFACKPDEICHVLSSGLTANHNNHNINDCFVPPCYLRTICLNASRPITEQLQQLLPNFHFKPALPGCRPNNFVLNNYCARLLLHFSKLRMSYATTVDDVCNAVKSLPSLKKYNLRYDHSGTIDIGVSCDIKADFSSIEQHQNIIEVTLSSLNNQIQIGSDGKQYAFIHELARNLSKEALLIASTNLKLHHTNQITAVNNANDDNDDAPLPPMSMMLGTEQLNDYWHRILLGIIEIQVDTMIVTENDFGSRLLVPIVCATILMITLICIFLIWCYSQRKRRALLMKHTTAMIPNNEEPSAANLFQYLTNSNNTTSNNVITSHSNLIHPIHVTSLNQTNRNNSNYSQLPPGCESLLQTRKCLSSQLSNVNGRRILVCNENNSNNNNNLTNSNNIRSGLRTFNTNCINMNKSSGSIII